MYMIKAQNPGKLGKFIFLRFYSRNNVADRCWLNNLLYRVAQLLLFFLLHFNTSHCLWRRKPLNVLQQLLQ